MNLPAHIHISQNEQGTPEWKKDRAGLATASCFQSGIIAKAKSGNGESAGRRNYRLQLVTELLTGEPVEGFKNGIMDAGNVFEEQVKPMLEKRHGFMIERAGFITNDKLPRMGCSPDGLLEELPPFMKVDVKGYGGIEVKSAIGSTAHVEALEDGMPNKHVAQVQGQMLVTEASWWLFVSFDPRMPKGLDIYTQLIRREDAYIAMLEKEIRKFNSEVEHDHKKYLAMAEQRNGR